MDKGFAPIINGRSRILILGTFPGCESREANEYYANKRNQFWKIIRDIFNGEVEFKNYNDKIECLKQNNIALWDIVEQCSSKGNSSLDSKINWETAIYNDISDLIARYPNIEKIILTSGACEKWFDRKNDRGDIEGRGIKITRVISPSPAATKPYVDKLSEWRTNIVTDTMMSADGTDKGE